MFSSQGIFIEALHLRGYRCFADSKKLRFQLGINVIAGANNAGKTALLSAIGLAGQASRHASEKTKPSPLAGPPNPAERRYTLAVGKQVMRQIESFSAPVSQRSSLDLALQDLRKLHAQEVSTFHVAIDESEAEAHPYGTPWQWARVARSADGPYKGANHTFNAEATDTSQGAVLLRMFRQCTFLFQAERYRIGRGKHGASDVLLADASNLPEVLNKLQSNPKRFERFNVLVRRVFSTLTRVSVEPIGGNELQVLVWKGDLDSDRIDLAAPLNECGTGLGQVLAILYVVSNSPFPRTILIDEPNTFLHPGAVFSLLEIFQEFSEHQYIITTHSPGVISAAQPSSLHLLESHGYETAVRTLTPSEIEDQRAVLAAVGARLEDVFGPESILWVEGPSEAEVLPVIARAFKIRMAKVAVRPLAHTDDVAGRFAKLKTQVYQQLANGVALIPPACGFLLDREQLTDEKMAQLKSNVSAPLSFINRRMLENYFLSPRAVHHLLTTLEETPPTVEAVEECMLRLASTQGLAVKGCQPLSPQWRVDVHGAKLLAAVVTELSATRHNYDKVRYAPVLVSWLLEHEQQELVELAESVRGLVDQAPSRQGWAAHGS